MIEKTDSIIFDLDGTLWDSTVTVAEAWQAAADKVDYVKDPVTPADVRGIAGLPYDVIYRKLFPYLTEEQRNDLKALCAEEELLHLKKKGGILYPELKETLDYLKDKYRLFIVSNCQSGYIEGFMEHHKLQEYFDDCECFGNAELPKAENIKIIVSRNKLNSAVYVGDTQGDLDAARGSKVPFIYAAYGFGNPDEYDEKINHFSGLKELF